MSLDGPYKTAERVYRASHFNQTWWQVVRQARQCWTRQHRTGEGQQETGHWGLSTPTFVSHSWASLTPARLSVPVSHFCCRLRSLCFLPTVSFLYKHAHTRVCARTRRHARTHTPTHTRARAHVHPKTNNTDIYLGRDSDVLQSAKQHPLTISPENEREKSALIRSSTRLS